MLIAAQTEQQLPNLLDWYALNSYGECKSCVICDCTLLLRFAPEHLGQLLKTSNHQSVLWSNTSHPLWDPYRNQFYY